MPLVNLSPLKRGFHIVSGKEEICLIIPCSSLFTGNLRTAVTHKVYTGPSTSHIVSARQIELDPKPKVKRVKKIAIQKRRQSEHSETSKAVENSEPPPPKKKKPIQKKKSEKL